MSENLNLTPEQQAVLMKIVAGRTGTDPINLREELSGEGSDGVLGALGADREKLQALMDNREELEKMLSSPQVRTLLQQLLGAADQN